ncbi:hypothetical protein NQ176_g1696 [Zarea fungicola]|uniref:Uncharacterized protein n=1 Tax=Zarea fungicola TaxID=93591 RepID=A0ACC1NT28_9HYPO|nr:hypothetical protein NQ176_g1696 [Lecanicillium fungicola]
MDPATVGGLAIGAVSLLFDVFDNSIKIFKFLSSMVDMPRDCEQCRLRLLIEYNRLLAWGKAIGLMDTSGGANPATALGTDAAELCGIISRIEWLLSEFRDINARWKNEFHLHLNDDQSAAENSVAVGNSSLEVAYEKLEEQRKHLRGTSHIIRWMSSRMGEAKEILSHPRRIRWVMVDKEAFEALLKDLHILTGRLHQLAGDYRQKRIGDLAEETYRELVITKNTVSELRDMIGAVTTLIAQSKDIHAMPMDCHNRNYDYFRDLLQLKEINQAVDDTLASSGRENSSAAEEAFMQLISVTKLDGAALDYHYTYAESDGGVNVSKLARRRGTFVRDGVPVEAWIEWRSNGSISPGSAEDKKSRLRVMALAQMLSNKKPPNFCAPNCIGVVDDSAARGRYGWIFSMPAGSHRETSLISLHCLLGQTRYKPTLAQRISLAWTLSSTLMGLHTSNWLHKGIHSGNVIFPFQGGHYNADEPILSGFDYARPETGGTTTRSLEPKWDIYRWPGIQREAPKMSTSRKTYDIYSLGLVLLEIAHWQPLHSIIGLKRWPQPSAQDSRIRAWLLKEDAYAPFNSDPVAALRDIAGDRYWRAVVRCIVAHGAMGLHVDEEANQTLDIGVGIKLLETFDRLVVKELENVSI